MSARSFKYRGVRQGDLCKVTVLGRPLDPRVDLRDHSSAGFDWGDGGNGSAQLALAILADHAGDEVALSLHQQFKAAVVARLPSERWTLGRDDIDHALAALETSGAP
jgi:hypothetical protein